MVERWIEEMILALALSDCLICAPEKFQVSSIGFKPKTSVMTVQHTYQLSYEATLMWGGQFVGLMCSRERNDEWKKCLRSVVELTNKMQIIYNYPPKGRWIVVDIYRDVKRRGIYLPLFTDPKGVSCFSIYQIRWIKKRFLNFFFWKFRATTHHFSLCLQNSEYPRTFQVTGANQNSRKLLSTDLVNTK